MSRDSMRKTFTRIKMDIKNDKKGTKKYIQAYFSNLFLFFLAFRCSYSEFLVVPIHHEIRHV